MEAGVGGRSPAGLPLGAPRAYGTRQPVVQMAFQPASPAAPSSRCSCRRRRRLPTLVPFSRAAGDDLLSLVLGHLRPSDLATAEGVCRRWRLVAAEHRLWQPHAEAVAAAAGAQQQTQQLRQQQQQQARQQKGADPIGVPWKELFLEAKVGGWVEDIDML